MRFTSSAAPPVHTKALLPGPKTPTGVSVLRTEGCCGRFTHFCPQHPYTGALARAVVSLTVLQEENGLQGTMTTICFTGEKGGKLFRFLT